MNINYITKNQAIVTDEFEKVFDKKINRLAKFIGENAEVKVTVKEVNLTNSVKIHITSGDINLHANGDKSRDLGIAFDNAFNKIKRQVSKQKFDYSQKRKDNDKRMPENEDLELLEQEIEDADIKYYNNQNYKRLIKIDNAVKKQKSIYELKQVIKDVLENENIEPSQFKTSEEVIEQYYQMYKKYDKKPKIKKSEKPKEIENENTRYNPKHYMEKGVDY